MKMHQAVKADVLRRLNRGEITAPQAINELAQLGIYLAPKRANKRVTHVDGITIIRSHRGEAPEAPRKLLTNAIPPEPFRDDWRGQE